MFKNIDFIKKIVNKDFYALCVIKKNYLIFHKIHIRFKKEFLNLIYIDIYDFITFYEYHNNKYIIIFLNN